MITLLNNEGCSISSIARIVGFSKVSIGRAISKIASACRFVFVRKSNEEYEMDELRTFVGNKKNESWIMYALSKATKKIAAFTVGRRTKENIRKITDELLKTNPKMIFTDRLTIYSSLIPGELHDFNKRVTNHIERKNLHFRQQLRRLQRKTICFSRSEDMLKNVVSLFVSTQM